MAEGEEKTEAPTPRRRELARQRGQFARSEDLCAAAVILTAILMLQLTGPRLISAWKAMVTQALSLNATPSSEPLTAIAKALWPMLVAIVIVAIAVNLVQVGFNFRFRAKFDAINPSKGLERVFSKRSAGVLVMHMLKISAVALVAWFAAGGAISRIVSLQSLDPQEGLASGGAIVVSIGVRLAFVLLVLAAIDYGLKRWRHERDLRMTRREVREEMREMHVHESVRKRQREVAGRTN